MNRFSLGSCAAAIALSFLCTFVGIAHAADEVAVNVHELGSNQPLSGVKLTIREYLTAAGQSPFGEWLAGLDVVTRARIQARVLRFEGGNLGDHKGFGDGVLEARLAFGPGYRLYFGKDGPVLILLLLGGDKSTQRHDIREAKKFWAEYRKAKGDGTAK